jgi:Rieske Fe-S protein
MCVAAVEDTAVGGYKLFRYPTEDDPCILLRLDAGKFVAFNQHCTHLSCPVVFNSGTCRLECPCQKGAFSAEHGGVIAGPPREPLEALDVAVRNGGIWVTQRGITIS